MYFKIKLRIETQVTAVVYMWEIYRILCQDRRISSTSFFPSFIVDCQIVTSFYKNLALTFALFMYPTLTIIL